MPYGIIYKAQNKITGKCYVGKTIQKLKDRWTAHRWSSYSGTSQSYFHRSVRKHRIENFDWSVLEECESLSNLNEREIYWIKELNSISNGYNILPGGRGGGQSENQKLALMKALKGVPKTESHKRNMRLCRLGKKASSETCMKMSLRTSGTLNPNYGKRHDPEMKKLIGSKSVGRNWSRGRSHPSYVKNIDYELICKLYFKNNSLWVLVKVRAFL